MPQLSVSLTGTLDGHSKYFVFVDDHSTDQTTDAIRKHFVNSGFHIIEKNTNSGPGDSFNRGFEWILTQSADEMDIIVTMEGDNTSDLSILPQMLAISNLGFDLVLASLYAQGGGFSKTSFIRRFLSFWANILFRSIFNVKVLTLSSFYRVYSISLLKKIQSSHTKIISESGFISMLEILLKAIHLDATIIEIPMQLKSDTRTGKSKMKIARNVVDYILFLLRYKFPGKE